MGIVRLVIASANVHKIREIKSILKGKLPFDLLSLKDFPDYVPPHENGKTFLENATIKAEHCAKTLKEWALADDSGLIVPALKGAPGIYSARYAGSNASDADNRKKLLKEMAGLEENERFAFFECCVALASPEGIKKSACANCEGKILSTERGGGGFGYDPLFEKHEYNKTFAELKEEVKNQISHRKKALDKLLPTLLSMG